MPADSKPASKGPITKADADALLDAIMQLAIAKGAQAIVVGLTFAAATKEDPENNLLAIGQHGMFHHHLKIASAISHTMMEQIVLRQSGSRDGETKH